MYDKIHYKKKKKKNEAEGIMIPDFNLQSSFLLLFSP